MTGVDVIWLAWALAALITGGGLMAVVVRSEDAHG